MPGPTRRTDIQYIEIVRALHDYVANDPSMISLKKGDYIYVLSKDNTGWWNGTVGDNTGWFPSNWIEPVESTDSPQTADFDDITNLQSSTPQSPTKVEDAPTQEKLPHPWRRKQAPNGQVYYYNPQTNQTTYDLDQVKSATVRKRASLIWKQNEVVANQDNKPLPLAPNSSSTWVAGPKTLLTDTTEVTWELLINNILKSISDLNYSAKNDIKPQFIQQSSQIIRAIRDMLACSGTISADSVIIRSNKSLQTYHANIMTSLSKINLAAKVAAGLWPPPDAVHSMRYQAGQVLLSVRHFVAVAQDLGITLQPVIDDGADEFDMKGSELSDTELVSRLDQNSEIIMNSIAALVTKITRDRVLSTALIDHVRKTVTEIGQLMSIIEDIKFDTSLDIENLVGGFLNKKENLYAVVNELVTASSTGEDGFAPANALGMMLESATGVLEATEDILVAAKLLVDHKELITQKSMYDQSENAGGDSELVLLQKRAQSLNFLDRNQNSPADSNNSRSSPSWTRDQRTLSNDSRLTGTMTPTNNNTNSWTRDTRTLSGQSVGSNGTPTQDQVSSMRKLSFSQQAFRRISQELPSPMEGTQSASKLSKFFGDDQAAGLASARNSDSQRPWFLRKEENFEISYNMEGAVNGGTFISLVERLTVHDQPVDPGFASSFLMTFHLFGTAKQLFDCLVARFTMEPPEGLNNDELKLWIEKKLSPIQIRVCNALKLWIESYWLEQFDDICLDDIHAFASGPMMQFQSVPAQRILELVQRRVTADVIGNPPTTPKSKRAGRPEEFQPPLLPKSLKRFTLIDLDPLEVARQLTIMESNLFLKIMPIELMKQEWAKKNTTSLAVNVRAMTSLSTKITGWVVCTILQEADLKRRAFILKFFIKVAERCLMLNNFNTLLAIQSAFNSSTISRLKKTWELLSNKTRNLFESLRRSTDHSRNFADYRAALKRSNLPALPFLGLFLTDLTFTDDGNPDLRNNGKLINFDKYARTAKVITDLQKYQVPYAITEVPEIQDYLIQSINDRGTRDVQDLYELSLRLEPRDERGSGGSGGGPEDVNRELEAKIAMLEKAGML
ncbi:ras guanine nucleotide exchange factor domain-containing protein [Globomyces pollinis-pini]|nr:ras guanine nucleotide exchange factor domain-containing protein [Globomyces pollinis-pini]